MPIIQTAEIEAKEILPGFLAKFIHTPNQTIGYLTIVKGSVLPEHYHIHEQITHVLAGQLEMTIDGITHIIEAGKVAVIPSQVKHSAIALTDCIVMDVFNPAREDYK